MTNTFEIYIIELKKYQGSTNNTVLDTWVRFLENPEVIEMSEENREVKKAKEVLEEISQDEHERYLAELRQKYIMDQKAILDAGYDKGVIEGIKEEKRNIAKKMKSKRIKIEQISELTGLTKEEIEKI